MVFILQFVNMVYHIDWFVYIEEFLYLWDKSHFDHGVWSVLLMCWLIWFASILLRTFASMFISDIDW